MNVGKVARPAPAVKPPGAPAAEKGERTAQPPTEAGTATRRYDATRRRASAAARRARILQAAQALFVARGYAATTMAAIAGAAGVSVETIYLAAGSKPALVRELVEAALSGEGRPVPPLERKGVREIVAELDPRRKVRQFARLARGVQERVAPIWAVAEQAASADAELASLVAELLARHVGSMRRFADHLAETGALRPDLSPALAADVLWATNSAALYRLLTEHRQWSADRVERFLAETWERLLLRADG